MHAWLFAKPCTGTICCDGESARDGDYPRRNPPSAKKPTTSTIRCAVSYAFSFLTGCIVIFWEKGAWCAVKLPSSGRYGWRRSRVFIWTFTKRFVSLSLVRTTVLPRPCTAGISICLFSSLCRAGLAGIFLRATHPSSRAPLSITLLLTQAATSTATMHRVIQVEESFQLKPTLQCLCSFHFRPDWGLLLVSLRT